MITLSPTVRILVATQPIDFRNGIDGLAAVCRQKFEQDPMSGCAFIFRNRRNTSIKILFYDGQGFWLCQKRLSESHMKHWPTDASGCRTLESHQLHVLLAGGDADAAHGAPLWRPVRV
ncbi:MAG: IS66 family insertion sequence element accessory protein TnpB [Pirellulales bacterium]